MYERKCAKLNVLPLYTHDQYYSIKKYSENNKVEIQDRESRQSQFPTEFILHNIVIKLR